MITMYLKKFACLFKQRIPKSFYNNNPVEGLFYCVRFPEQWSVEICRYDVTPNQSGHLQFWNECVVPRLAEQWGNHNQELEHIISLRLRDKYTAFPRGRIAKQLHRSEYRVYHGGNVPPQVDKKVVDTLFGLRNPMWVLDDHEGCLEFDKNAIRSFLGIEEDWISC